MSEELRYRLAGVVGGTAIDALLATTRYSVEGAEHYEGLARAGRPVLLALWHGRLLACAYYHRGRPLTTLISRSRDGEYASRLFERWGFRIVRGSSSRGARTASRALLDAAAAGESIAVTVDGPRGPLHRVKPGFIELARRSGLPIVPASASARGAWWFQSWDRFLVPRPFTRVHMAFGAPECVSADADAAALAGAAVRLETALTALTEAVDRRAGQPLEARP